jgi:CHAD domain-containing protein
MELDFVKLKQIKPALTGYIRESQALLKQSAVPDEKSIHDVRILMKKSRSVLKLAAPQLDKVYHEKNISSLREVGRIMCPWRETSVQRKTLKEFRKEYPDIFSNLNENAKLTLLLEKHEAVTEPQDKLKAALEQIDALLNKTGYRIRFQSMDKMDPQILLKDLEVTYTRVVDIYLSCRNNPKPVMLHKFRKKAKEFLYQLYFFRPLNPSVVKSLEKKLEGLTQNLGKFNDIVQIIKVLEYTYSEGANLPPMDELVIKLREAQDRYLAKVWPVAYQIFCPGQILVNVLGFKLLVI